MKERANKKAAIWPQARAEEENEDYWGKVKTEVDSWVEANWNQETDAQGEQQSAWLKAS